MLWLSFRSASEFFARASVEIVVATVLIRGVSHVAANPIACGNTVAYPDRAIPCRPSLHQSYSGTLSRGIATAWFCICETFSSSVIRPTRSATRFCTGCAGSLYTRAVCADAAPAAIKANRSTVVRQTTRRRRNVIVHHLIQNPESRAQVHRKTYFLHVANFIGNRTPMSRVRLHLKRAR